MSDDLFASTANYYATYRPDYPAELYEVARAAFGLRGAPRWTLLDLGTGPGFIAVALTASRECLAKAP